MVTLIDVECLLRATIRTALPCGPPWDTLFEPHISSPVISLVYDKWFFWTLTCVQGTLHTFAILQFHVQILGRVSWEYCFFIPHCFHWPLGTLGTKDPGVNLIYFLTVCADPAPSASHHFMYIFYFCLYMYTAKSFDFLFASSKGL